ncbi:hypothetical protein CKY28_03510 [Sphingomonas lenta]|uniref:SRPBCC family protein n=2 Tax=Sphingomonas lenta TaxID=1141887 RepID=A0A2A2SIR1_9SPHN|nr:hypothetical protein CKY28_03510 [Sphingomonas lenta]
MLAPPSRRRTAAIRITAALAVALAFALGVYLLLEFTRPNGGLISFSFLIILPGAISAFVAYVADPWGERSRGAYLLVPVWLSLAAIVASAAFLREGVICIVMLAPLWLLSGMAGAALTYSFRRRRPEVDIDAFYSAALLALPVIALQVEPFIPLPEASRTVSRSVVVHAPPQAIWPLLRGVPDVRPGEGRWNFTQDVIGVPRPVGARLIGNGLGADRHAVWSHRIRFRERVVDWEPNERIGWRFIFDDVAAWAFTDRHLTPNSSYFRVTTGGYAVEALSGGGSRVTLTTRYWMRTPVNAYCALWGKLFLGDLENNLLAVIRQRAEGRPAAR